MTELGESTEQQPALYEPPTEPLPPPERRLTPLPSPALPPLAVPPPPPPPPAAPAGAFMHARYRFTTGLRAGEIATIRGDDGSVLLSYRSFASVVGVIAALVSGIVLLAGLAAVAFLFAEGEVLRAFAALVLTVAFTFFITVLVPRISITLYDENHPALTLAQTSVFPTARYLVSTANGVALAELKKSFFSRIGRHRWTITHEGRYVGEAVEASFPGAILRKFLGKFSRSFETNIRITHGGVEAARILRRPDAAGQFDVLEMASDALDRRVAVALATLILGREP